MKEGKMPWCLRAIQLGSYSTEHIQVMDSTDIRPEDALSTRACLGIGLPGCKIQLRHHAGHSSSRVYSGYELPGWAKNRWVSYSLGCIQAQTPRTSKGKRQFGGAPIVQGQIQVGLPRQIGAQTGVLHPGHIWAWTPCILRANGVSCSLGHM